MPMTLSQILDEVKKLPNDEQMDLIDLLLAQVRAEPNPEIEQAWDEEIARRLERLRAGRAKTIPADEVFARVRNTIARQSKKRA
jgi:putative addiction module component (TIGR02574 family)